MKRIISVLLISIMVLLLVGCEKDNVTENAGHDFNHDEQTEAPNYSGVLDDYNDFAEQNQTSNMDKMLSAKLQYPSSNAEWEYNVYDCYVEITGHKGGAKETLVVPDEIESLPVWKYSLKTYISDYDTIKAYRDTVKNIVLPKDLLVIGENACSGLENLKTITLSDCLVVIEDRAFEYCGSLENITFPETLEEIEGDAFSNCHSLKSIELPKSVEKVGYSAFSFTNSYYDSERGYNKSMGVELTVNNPEMGFDDRHIGDINLIRGHAGSTAAKYAAENNIKFEVID